MNLAQVTFSMLASNGRVEVSATGILKLCWAFMFAILSMDSLDSRSIVISDLRVISRVDLSVKSGWPEIAMLDYSRTRL